jgi:TatD DNase family protein
VMDFHCHVDLYPGARDVYARTIQRNEFTWLVTTSPKAFAATTRALSPSPKVLITPGLHPEIAHERAAELPQLLEQIEGVSAVGEVGLDGSPRFRQHYDVQRKIFRAVIARCAELGGRTLSVHSRRAVRDVLAELDAHPGYGTVVMHWFSGTAAELKAAEAAGCWFSIGPAMFDSANGRSLAAAMPRDRVVPESDGPFAKLDGKPVMPWEAEKIAEPLAHLWQMSPAEASSLLAENGRRLQANF